MEVDKVEAVMKQDGSKGWLKPSYVPGPVLLPICHGKVDAASGVGWGGGGAKEINSQTRTILETTNTLCFIRSKLPKNDHAWITSKVQVKQL